MENTQTLEIVGWTDNPADAEFAASRIKADGRKVGDRLTIYITPENQEPNADGSVSKLRVNFWDQWAREAYESLVVKQQRALIKLKDPRVTPYTDKHVGKQRVSLNVNFRSQYEVLDSEFCPIGNGFELILNKIKNREVSQLTDESPFDSSPI